MDRADGYLLAFGVTVLAVSVLLLCNAVRSLQEDMELLRITAAVPEMKGN